MVKRTIRYPNSRKSPFEHDVGGYTRKNGNKVSGYSRGSGGKPQRSQRSRVVGKPEEDINIHGYVVNLTYSDKPGDGETILAISDQEHKTILEDYKEIMDEAFEEKVDPRDPIAVHIEDPSLGKIIEVMSKKVKDTIKWGKPRAIKAAKIGAKYTIKATMIAGSTARKVGMAGYDVTKELARLSAFAVQKEYIQSLLKLCYQDDPAKRLAARVTLKKRFPEIYDMTDFSRETRGRSRNQPKLTTFPKRYRTVP